MRPSAPGGLVLALCLLAAPDARSQEIEREGAAEDALPLGERLSGRDLYDRFLDNRLGAAVQLQRIVSRDPGGSEQTTRFWTRWKQYRNSVDGNGGGPAARDPSDVVAKTLVEFTHPFDMRHTTYLMIVYEEDSSQQWVYRPSTREVNRVRLESVSIMGTDFDYDDIAFEKLDDADYRRLPDGLVGGVPVYVVEARPKPHVESQYSRSVVHMEKERYVGLRSRMWDRADVPVKELTADPASIREYDGVWIATESHMRDLQENTTSTLFIDQLQPNPEIPERSFSLRRLHMSH